MPAFLATMQAKIIAVGLLVALIGGAIFYIYDEGKDAGSGKVTTAVQEKTISTLDAARAAKEKADAETREMPYDKKVEGLGK